MHFILQNVFFFFNVKNVAHQTSTRVLLRQNADDAEEHKLQEEEKAQHQIKIAHTFGILITISSTWCLKSCGGFFLGGVGGELKM